MSYFTFLKDTYKDVRFPYRDEIGVVKFYIYNSIQIESKYVVFTVITT